MLLALPIIIATSLCRLFAISADVTLSQVYTASAAVFYGHRLGRTAVESVMLLPAPSYLREGRGIVSSDVALFAALSPIASPIERPSPTLGECVSAASSMLMSLFHAGRTTIFTVTAAVSLAKSPAPVPLLTLDPYVGALDGLPRVDGASALPLYLDSMLVDPLASLSTCSTLAASEYEWCDFNGTHAHMVLMDSSARAKPMVMPNTCSLSSLASCGLGDYRDGVTPAVWSPAHLRDNMSVPSQLGWCGRGSEDAYPTRVDSTSAKRPHASGSRLPNHTCLLSSLGSCGRDTQLLHAPRVRPIAGLWKVLDISYLADLCCCFALLVLTTIQLHIERLYCDVTAYLRSARSSPSKALPARDELEHTDPAPEPEVLATPPTPTQPAHTQPPGKRKWQYVPRLTPDGQAMKRPWIRKID
ncbi:hypothetical protein FRC12_014943 [Ceratobasidium sp. 428]|nr:hypothetical protein FRC12_014943 [Ceratobasidium sp. 428]